MRLTTQQEGEHHISVPVHTVLRPGTLATILADMAEHLGVTREELIDRLSL